MGIRVCRLQKAFSNTLWDVDKKNFPKIYEKFCKPNTYVIFQLAYYLLF